MKVKILETTKKQVPLTLKDITMGDIFQIKIDEQNWSEPFIVVGHSLAGGYWNTRLLSNYNDTQKFDVLLSGDKQVRKFNTIELSDMEEYREA